MTVWTQALSAALLHFVWQGSAVAVVLWAVLFGLRRRPAAWRYAATGAALGLLAALPLATAWILARGAARAPAAAADVAVTPAAFFTAGGPAAGPAAWSWLVRLEGWALPVWSLGVLILSLRLVWGARQVQGLRRRAEPVAAEVREAVTRMAARMGVRQAVSVGISPAAESPSVVGWIRPLILLPSASLLGLTPEQLEAVLAHELAHIRRFDYLVNLAQTLIETLLFYHPAVWWVSARMRHERELCCDDLAVASCGDALCYARALTRLEKLRLAAPEMAMAATGGPLFYRVQRLMGVSNSGYRTSRMAAALTLGLGIVCLGWNVRFAKAQPVESVQAAETPQEDQEQTTAPPKALTVTTQDGRTLTVNYTPRSEQAAEEETRARKIAAEGRNRGVQIDTAGAKVVKSEPVEYPGAAIEQNIQGTVTVEAILDANGDVSDAHVLAGPQELRKAALRSVLGWRFQPDAAGAGAARQVNINFQIPPGGFPRELVSDDQVGERVRALEKAMQAIQALKEKHQGQLEPGAAPELERQYQDLQKKLAESQNEIAHRQSGLFWTATANNPADAVGRVVKVINVRGVPEAAVKEMKAGLPVHVGDTLTAETMSKLESAVTGMGDGHMVVYTLSEGNTVEIHIATARK